ncbi:MAG TPA: UrcA family protein [Sphingomicrobium sp.]|nr:UrcA family protein [Sphingomicrobium sp.]
MRKVALVAFLIVVGATSARAEEISHRIATFSVSSDEVAGNKASPQLQNRIGRAIDAVCGTAADSLEQYAELARCRKSARAAVVEQIARNSRANMLAARK